MDGPVGRCGIRELGLHELLTNDCGHVTQRWDQYMGPEQVAHRDFTVTTPQQLASLAFYHPACMSGYFKLRRMLSRKFVTTRQRGGTYRHDGSTS